jgi:uncharacterized protein with HEPN domain
MNRETAKRLLDALSAGREIQEYAAGTTRAQFLESRSLQLIFERLFEIVGEAISQAEDEFPTLRKQLPDVGDIIGMRNRIAHGYDDIDNELIWATAIDKVPVLCANLEQFLEEEPID